MVIDNLFPKDSIGSIYGPTCSYKSFFAVDAACCIAAGIPFHGRKSRKAPVIYVSSEGHQRIKRRVLAWCIKNKVGIESLPLYVTRHVIKKINTSTGNTLISKINTIAGAVGSPGVVIIDAINFNRGPDMMLYVDVCDAIRKKYKCCVMSIHSTGNIVQRSVVVRAAQDFEYAMNKDLHGVLQVTCKKMKDFCHPKPMAFIAQVVGTGVLDVGGWPETSLVLDEVQYSGVAG